MPITQAMCTSFKSELLSGVHNFGNGVTRATPNADTYKIALYTSSATLGSGTTVYNTSNEVVGAGYTAGGNTLTITQVPTSSGTTAYISFGDTSWVNATFTARGALIYNQTQGNKAVAVFDFGGDRQVITGTFTVAFPAVTGSTAVLRIA